MYIGANGIALWALVRREMMRIIRIWPQTLLPPIITMILYFLIFGQLMGSRIGQVHGIPYVHYIAPGLIMMSVISNAYSNVVSSFFGAKFQRNIEEMLVAPIPYSILLWGFLSGGLLRGLLVGLLVSGIVQAFCAFPLLYPGMMLLIAGLTALLFSLAGLINGIFAKKFDDISIVPTFVLTPLTYLGGVFYAVDLLPSTWQRVMYANPIFYIVNSFRYGMLGHSDIAIRPALAVLTGFVLALYGIALWLLHRGTGVRT